MGENPSTRKPIFSRWLREPLVHFLVAGALLFVAFDWLGRDGAGSGDAIVLDEARIVSLQARFEQLWQRPPTPGELEGLIDAWVEEELLYREGIALGLERNDPVVRRRVAQQMAFISESMLDAEPGDAELRAWLNEHRDRYVVPPRYTFRQFYFSPDQFGSDVLQAAESALAALSVGATDVESSGSVLPGIVNDVVVTEIGRTFGQAFADGLSTLPVGEWAGPVPSGFGAHVVFIESREPSRVPELSEVRNAVTRDLLYDRSQRARQTLIGLLKERYPVRREAANGPADDDAPRGGADDPDPSPSGR